MNFYSDTATRISRAYNSLSDLHKRMADFILKSPVDAAMMTIDELSHACGVSNATANRFAKALGFDGFSDFRTQQAEEVKQALLPVEKLRTQRDGSASCFDIITGGIEQDIANLQQTLETLTDESCERAVNMVLGAERIFTYGSGISYHIAGILTHELEPFCRGNVSMLAATGNGINAAYRRLVHVTPRDLLVFISFPRYAADTLELYGLARQRETRILCITDRPSSPLAGEADVVLYAQAERRLLPNSATAAFALVDGLVAAVANRSQDAVDVQMRLSVPRPSLEPEPDGCPERQP